MNILAIDSESLPRDRTIESHIIEAHVRNFLAKLIPSGKKSKKIIHLNLGLISPADYEFTGFVPKSNKREVESTECGYIISKDGFELKRTHEIAINSNRENELIKAIAFADGIIMGDGYRGDLFNWLYWLDQLKDTKEELLERVREKNIPLVVLGSAVGLLGTKCFVVKNPVAKNEAHIANGLNLFSNLVIVHHFERYDWNNEATAGKDITKLSNEIPVISPHLAKFFIADSPKLNKSGETRYTIGSLEPDINPLAEVYWRGKEVFEDKLRHGTNFYPMIEDLVKSK